MLLKNVAIHYKQKNQSKSQQSMNISDVVAVKSFDFHFQSGRTYAIIGPSGCGKSSILLSMAGLIQPTKGSVEYKGLPMLQPHSDISLILQDYGLFPWKTVWQNAALGLSLRKNMTDEENKQVGEILEFLGLTGLENRYPKELSGGQRQRVAIARALATNPQLLLMDEPLSALDALTREAMQDLLIDIWQKQQLTLVIVTHNIEEAVFLGQEIIVMSPSPGAIVKVFTNPNCGDHEFRSSNEFYKYCSEIRQQLLPNKQADAYQSIVNGDANGDLLGGDCN